MEDFDTLNTMADSGELTAESLQERLNEYHKAFEQEYAEANTKKPDDIEQNTRDFFKKNVNSAAAQVVWLSQNAASESVQFAACKYVISEAFTKAQLEREPFQDLIDQLMQKPAPAQDFKPVK